MKKALAMMMVLSVALCGVAVATPTTDLGHIYWSGDGSGGSTNSRIKYCELDGTGVGVMTSAAPHVLSSRDVFVDEAAGIWACIGEGGPGQAPFIMGATDDSYMNNLGNFASWIHQVDGDGSTYVYVAGAGQVMDRVNYDSTGRVTDGTFFPAATSAVAFGSSTGAGVIYSGGGTIYAQTLAGGAPIGSIPAPGGGISYLEYDAVTDTLFILRPNNIYASISGAAVQASDNSSLFQLGVDWSFFDVARDATGALKLYYARGSGNGDIYVADLDGSNADFIVNVNTLHGQGDVRSFDVTDALVVPEPAGLGLLGIALLGLRKRRN